MDQDQVAAAMNTIHKEPHPWILPPNFSEFVGKTCSFVGKVKGVEKNILKLLLADDKTEVIVKNYTGDPEIKGYVEIRGIVNKD